MNVAPWVVPAAFLGAASCAWVYVRTFWVPQPGLRFLSRRDRQRLRLRRVVLLAAAAALTAGAMAAAAAGILLT